MQAYASCFLIGLQGAAEEKFNPLVVFLFLVYLGCCRPALI